MQIEGQRQHSESFHTDATTPDIVGAANDPAQAPLSETLQDTHPSIGGSSGDHFALKDVDEAGNNNITNPLVPGQPAFVQEIDGKLRYLGHSSTYAFTQQVLQILQQESPSNPSPEFLPSPDSLAYKAELDGILPPVKPDISGLPSKGIALHYLQCIKFRTQPLFYLFDESEFNLRLQGFYKDAATYSSTYPVWYAHYLVLMAFGKALDPHEHLERPSPLQIPEYFQRALSVMPDLTYLGNEPLETTETLCCIALYLQCIDHRRAAISYVSYRRGCVWATINGIPQTGIALRMAHLYALHLDIQESIIGSQDIDRGRRIWWTVYALNQKLTSNSGLPNFLNDSDVKAPPPDPSPSDEDSAALVLHVRICQLLGFSINSKIVRTSTHGLSLDSTQGSTA